MKAHSAAFPEIAEFTKEQPYHVAYLLLRSLEHDPAKFSYILESVQEYQASKLRAQQTDFLENHTAGHA